MRRMIRVIAWEASALVALALSIANALLWIDIVEQLVQSLKP